MLKLSKENGLWELFGKHWLLHPINEWAQIFGKWNWYTFHFVHLYAEKDIMVPGIEFEFVIIGLGFRFRWNFSWEGTELQKRIDEVNSMTPEEIEKLRGIESLNDKAPIV